MGHESVQSEPEIGYRFLLFKELALVKCLYIQYFRGTPFIFVNIVVGIAYFMATTLQQANCVAVEEFAICLEMYLTLVFQDLFVFG